MSAIWEGDTRCAVMFGFDVDGISSALNNDPSTSMLPTLMSMREYGPSIGMPRILDLLDKHEIRASFYVPGYIAETHEELVCDIYNRGHEIGHHGYMHETPANLTPEDEEAVLDRGTEILERITGQRPLGYRSPSWELSQNTIQLLIDRRFAYDSSMMGNDIPYIVHEGDSQLIEIPVHWEWDDHPYFNFSPQLGNRNLMASPEHVYQVWSSGFEGAYYYGRAFILTMHPYIIGRPGRLRMLERLINLIKSMPGVEFTRAIDMANLFINKDTHCTREEHDNPSVDSNNP